MFSVKIVAYVHSASSQLTAQNKTKHIFSSLELLVMASASSKGYISLHFSVSLYLHAHRQTKVNRTFQLRLEHAKNGLAMS